MASDNLYISLDSLKAISSSLKTQKDQISKSFKSDILPAIKGSADCFKVSGLNMDEIISIFNSTFNTVDTNFGNLVDVLNNRVIKNYNEAAFAVKQTFNNQFASQLRDILNIK